MRSVTHPERQLPEGVVHLSSPLDVVMGRALDLDALMSPRVAADLCGVPTARVVAAIRTGTVRLTTIRGGSYVNLSDVERAIAREEAADGRD